MTHGDFAANPGFIEMGGGVQCDGGKGELHGCAESALHGDGLLLAVDVGEREGVVGSGNDAQFALGAGEHVGKLRQQGAGAIEVNLAQFLLSPAGGVQLQGLHHALHEGGGFEDKAFVGDVGGAGIHTEFGQNAVVGGLHFVLLVTQDDAGALLVGVVLSAGKEVCGGSAGQGAEDNEEPEATQSAEDGVQRQGVFFLIVRYGISVFLHGWRRYCVG